MLAERCGRFVRRANIEFDSTNIWDVRDCVQLLEKLAENRNLQALTLRPTSCHIDWPERDYDILMESFCTSLESIIQTSRKLRHLSLGCSEDLILVDNCEYMLDLLSVHQSHALESLHMASVKEDPESYTILDLPLDRFQCFDNLKTLSIDYDYLTNGLLESFTDARKAKLETLVINIHGIEADHEKIPNDTWWQLVKHSPKLEVTLNLIHSIDGVENFLDILRPQMPLAHLRMFFCSDLNVAAVNFIARHNYSTFKSLKIVDGITEDTPNTYISATDEDPFVMLAWKCPNLTDFTLIGYEMADNDVIAIARLRGAQLKTLAIPQCCIYLSFDPSEEFPPWKTFGCLTDDFNQEVSQCLGREWLPIKEEDLHPAIKDINVNDEGVYLSLLLQDQEYHL